LQVVAFGFVVIFVATKRKPWFMQISNRNKLY